MILTEQQEPQTFPSLWGALHRGLEHDCSTNLRTDLGELPMASDGGCSGFSLRVRSSPPCKPTSDITRASPGLWLSEALPFHWTATIQAPAPSRLMVTDTVARGRGQRVGPSSRGGPSLQEGAAWDRFHVSIHFRKCWIRYATWRSLSSQSAPTPHHTAQAPPASSLPVCDNLGPDASGAKAINAQHCHLCRRTHLWVPPQGPGGRACVEEKHL